MWITFNSLIFSKNKSVCKKLSHFCNQTLATTVTYTTTKNNNIKKLNSMQTTETFFALALIFIFGAPIILGLMSSIKCVIARCDE